MASKNEKEVLPSRWKASASERFNKSLSLELPDEHGRDHCKRLGERSQAFRNFRGSIKDMGLWKNNLASHWKMGKKNVYFKIW